MVTSHVSSQMLSIDSACCVPCSTLKKALFVKAERDYLRNQIGVVRDSVSILSYIVDQQDSLISYKDTQISLFKKNEVKFNEVLINKDKQIHLYDEKLTDVTRQRNAAGALAILSLILGIFVF